MCHYQMKIKCIKEEWNYRKQTIYIHIYTHKNIHIQYIIDSCLLFYATKLVWRMILSFWLQNFIKIRFQIRWTNCKNWFQMIIRVRFHMLHFGKLLFTQVCCTKNRHETTSKLYQIWKLIWLQAFIKLNQISFSILIFQSIICLEINNFHLKLSWKIFNITVKWIGVRVRCMG